MKVRKKWWLLPIIVVLLLVGALLIFARARHSHRSSTPSSELHRPSSLVFAAGCRAGTRAGAARAGAEHHAGALSGRARDSAGNGVPDAIITVIDARRTAA